VNGTADVLISLVFIVMYMSAVIGGAWLLANWRNK